MDNIKIRRWNSKREHFVEMDIVTSINYRIMWCTLINECDGPFELWTGLRDKDGLDVFEGDIFGSVKINKVSCNAKVVFDGGAFFVEHVKGHKNQEELPCVSRNHEIIGNIHENPEFLG